MPIEFARQSSNGRLTLVILPSGTPVKTLWTKLNCQRISEAREALRAREETALGRIDFWPDGPRSRYGDVIGEWASALGLKGAVWTALPPSFDGKNDRVPTQQEALAYLSALTGKTRELAEEYIRKAPHAIRTTYREAIEKELGWLPEPECR